MALTFRDRSVFWGLNMALLVVCLSNTSYAAWCHIDWDNDGVVEQEDFVARDPMRGYYSEYYLLRYYPDFYPLFFAGENPNRLDRNHNGMIDGGDLMGTLDPDQQTEGFYAEFYIYNYYPSFYPIFFPETDLCHTCTDDSQCGLGEYCYRTSTVDGNICDDTGRCELIPPYPICFSYAHPVCGCNGTTYLEACDALGAGTTIDHDGVCDGYCETNDDCAADELCLPAPGSCAGEKRCTFRPTSCAIALGDPVCGCDSITYNNECEALLAGVSVMSIGSCECEVNTDCNWPVGYCKTPDYDCEAQGICTFRSETCDWAVFSYEIDPVCTCNNFFQLNPESAMAAGLSVDYDGLCETIRCDFWPYTCPEGNNCVTTGVFGEQICMADSSTLCIEDIVPCMVDGQCQDGEYCYVDEMDQCGQPGACRPKTPQSFCGTDIEPVCGCDGITYDNDCLARVAGVNVYLQGADCRLECESDDDCTAEEFCEYPEFGCTGVGRCQLKLGTCDTSSEPVCGCDGNTYDNACQARTAGTSIVSHGRCPCDVNSDCETHLGEICLFEPGLCSTHGTCAIPPTDCSEQPGAKVCGCDGLTYEDECQANSAAVSIAHRGACCTASVQCAADEYCRFEAGTCSGNGACYPMPADCPLEYDPIVGCDDIAYDNARCAAVQGSSVQAKANLAVSGYSGAFCVIKNNGTLDCWGANWRGQGDAPGGVFEQVSVGPHRTCGITSSGNVQCWGDCYSGACSPPSGSYQQVEVGISQSCGLKSDGTVSCWGNGDITPEGAFTQITAGDYHFCGIKSNGEVQCWGSSTPPFGVFVQLAAHRYHTLGLRPNGSVECWGSECETHTPPPAGVFKSISTGDDHSCGLKFDETVECWGDNSHGQTQVPSNHFASFAAAGKGTCGLTTDGDLQCWGTFQGISAFSPYTKVQYIGVADYHMCGLRVDGQVFCSGANLETPSEIVTQMHVSEYVNCAVKQDGTAVCWGDAGFGYPPTPTPPQGEVFISATAGSSHACGLKPDNTPLCWGNDDFGQSTPPAQTFTHLSVGADHTCGIKTDGTLECWGINSFSVATPPAGQFQHVDTRENLNCGVDADGEIVCWGEFNIVQFTIPQGEFTQVAIGLDHACAISTDGSVDCWGDNNYGKATPPAGSFTSITANDDTTCGVKTDETFVCWGLRAI